MVHDFLSDDIRFLKGVGEKRASAFHSMGIHTAGDLLGFYPRAYEDRTKIKKIIECEQDETVCIRATVSSVLRKNMVRRNMTVYTAKVSDGTAVMEASCSASARRAPSRVTASGRMRSRAMPARAATQNTRSSIRSVLFKPSRPAFRQKRHFFCKSADYSNISGGRCKAAKRAKWRKERHELAGGQASATATRYLKIWSLFSS